METKLKLSELEAMALELGVADKVKKTIYKNGSNRVFKKDWVEVIQGHYLETLQKRENVEKIINLNPMLCYRYPLLRDDEQEAIWNSTDWGVEEKLDGVRILVVFSAVEGFSLYSRNLSVTDCLPIDYAQKVVSGVDGGTVGRSFRSFVMDAELICHNPKVNTVIEKSGVLTETMLQAVTAILNMDPKAARLIQNREAPLGFGCFDLLSVDLHDLKGFSYLKRRECLAHVVKVLVQAGMDARVIKVLFNPKNKKKYFESILREGGEGIVAKEKDSLYIPTTSRTRDAWVKVKRTASDTLADMGMGDTIDGFITGFVPGTQGKKHEGKVVGLRVSVYVRDDRGQEKVHEIAVVTNLKEELIENLTGIGGELKGEYYDCVVEVDGMSFTSRSRTLRHAKFKRFRTDKIKYDCVLEEAFIQANIL